MARSAIARAPRAEPKQDDTLIGVIREHATALRAVAKAIEHNTEQRKDADTFWANASHRLDSLCRFLKTKGPWLLGSMPAVLVAIGAIAPNAGHALSSLIMRLTGAS